MDNKSVSVPKRRFGLALLAAGAILLVLLAAAYVFRARLLTGAADFLVVDTHPLQPADLIFVLNGEYDSRTLRASQLYQQGYAPQIVMAHSKALLAEKLGVVASETDVAVAVMEKLGVPSDRIVILPAGEGVTSTYDEALALRQYAEGHSIRRILLVTSAFHTRRAAWIIHKELSGLPVTLEVAAAPYGGFDATDWWHSEDGLITVNNEYIKLLYYFWKYR